MTPALETPTSPRPDEAPFPRANDRFWFAATAILILGIALRQWRLSEAPFHSDEAVHAFFGGGFATYRFDPVYHGPLLYHLVAAVFGITGGFDRLLHHANTSGQYDFTARLVPSLLGIALLWMVLFPARQFLSNRAALASAGLLAVSPSVVSYSRRLLHDSLALFLTMGAVLCFLTALHHDADTSRGRGARVGVAAFLTLFLATKANCFFIAAMLAAGWVGWRGAGWIKLPSAVTRWIPIVLFLVVSVAAAKYPVSFVDIPNSDPPMKMATLDHRIFQVVALSSCIIFGLWLWTRRPDGELETSTETRIQAAPIPQAITSEVPLSRKQRRLLAAQAAPSNEPQSAENDAPTSPDSAAETSRATRRDESITTYVLALAAILWIYVFLYGNAAQVLIQLVNTHQFPIQTFKDGSANALHGIPKLLGYWAGQQGQPRLPSRHDYYEILICLYEVPVLLAALGGVWHASKHRSAVSDLLLWWSFTSWTVYALANEKVPWLLVHTVLPFALLGGWWIGQIRWEAPRVRPIFALAVIAGLIFSLRGVSGVNFERAGDNAEPMLYAQTPEIYRDTLREALRATRGDKRSVWIAGDKQWPAVWYAGPNSQYMDGSVAAIAGTPIPANSRIAVSDDKSWPILEKAGWTGKTTQLFIFPRASWTALQPRRYWHWFWTRDALPQNERNAPQDARTLSIFGGNGEWSDQTVIIGTPPRAAELKFFFDKLEFGGFLAIAVGEPCLAAHGDCQKPPNFNSFQRVLKGVT